MLKDSIGIGPATVADLDHRVRGAGEVVGLGIDRVNVGTASAPVIDILGRLGRGVNHRHAVHRGHEVVARREVKCASADVVILVPGGLDARVVAVLLHLSHGHIQLVAAPVIAVVGVIVGATLPVVLARRLERAVGAVQEDGIQVAGIFERIGVNIGDRTGDDHHVLAIDLIEVLSVDDKRLVTEKRLRTNFFHAVGDNNVARVDPCKALVGNLGDVGREAQRVKLGVTSDEAFAD